MVWLGHVGVAEAHLHSVGAAVSGVDVDDTVGGMGTA